MSMRIKRKAYRRAGAIVCALLVACAGLYVYAKSRATAGAAFALADDCPRGALVYVQFADLPALFKWWDSSTLKEQYLNSLNFQQFQERHLALKLLECWHEFDDALGFPLDAASLGSAAENRAALALYDIGRLELVFVAPVGEEKLSAIRFLQSAQEFVETKLPDGTIYYSRDVEADRGRQKQQLLFASLRGRFVLATSEQLLLRTLANINGKARKDRLSDDPAFETLSVEVKPHFATVWVDQTRLNDDWYFKHYWAMRNPHELKNIRAGIFDLEIQDGKWIEQRNFLTLKDETPERPPLPSSYLRRASELLPADVVHTRLRALDENPEATAALIRDALLDRLPQAEHESVRAANSYDFYDDWGANDDWDAGRYQYLDRDFDATIDDASTGGSVEDDGDSQALHSHTGRQLDASLGESLQAARSLRAATAESPRVSSGPLFVEFRRAAIISLAQPDNLKREQFEQAVSALVRHRLLVNGSRAGLEWTAQARDGASWRELELPMLGWKLCYTLRGTELIVSNSVEFLQAILRRQTDQPSTQAADVDFSSDQLDIINFAPRRTAFDEIVNRLDAPRVRAYWKQREGDGVNNSEHASQEFFSGNIASLLDVVSAVERIEIRRRTSTRRLQERVEIIFQTTTQTERAATSNANQAKPETHP